MSAVTGVVPNSFVTPWTVGHQAPLSMRFCRQEYRSALLSSAPENLPDPGIEPAHPTSAALAGRFFIMSATEVKGV